MTKYYNNETNEEMDIVQLIKKILNLFLNLTLIAFRAIKEFFINWKTIEEQKVAALVAGSKITQAS